MSASNSQPIFRTRTNESFRKCSHSKFSKIEDDIITMMVRQYENSGTRIHWSEIASKLSNKTGSDVSHRWNSVLNPELIKGSWTSNEDLIIVNWVKTHGPSKWTLLQKNYLQHRCGKQLRERWVNILSPSIQINGVSMIENALINNNENTLISEDNLENETPSFELKSKNGTPQNNNKSIPSSSQPIRNSQWTKEEDDLIFELYNTFGPKWKKMSLLIKGRSENSIKNRWQSIRNQRSRIMEGKDPILKRGRKNKNMEEIDRSINRSLLMMEENKEKLNDLPILTCPPIDYFEIDYKENEDNPKDGSIFSPTPIFKYPNLTNLDFSLDINPIIPIFKI